MVTDVFAQMLRKPGFRTFVVNKLNVTFNSSLLQSSQHLQAVWVAFAYEEFHVARYNTVQPGLGIF